MYTRSMEVDEQVQIVSMAYHLYASLLPLCKVLPNPWLKEGHLICIHR